MELAKASDSEEENMHFEDLDEGSNAYLKTQHEVAPEDAHKFGPKLEKI
jgi:hypothetical protein